MTQRRRKEICRPCGFEELHESLICDALALLALTETGGRHGQQVSGRVREVSGRVRNISGNARKCQDGSGRCQKMAVSAGIFQEMSGNARKCQDLSGRIRACHEMPGSVRNMSRKYQKFQERQENVMNMLGKCQDYFRKGL